MIVEMFGKSCVCVRARVCVCVVIVFVFMCDYLNERRDLMRACVCMIK